MPKQPVQFLSDLAPHLASAKVRGATSLARKTVTDSSGSDRMRGRRRSIFARYIVGSNGVNFVGAARVTAVRMRTVVF